MNRHIPHKAKKGYAQKQVKITPQRKEELTQIAREMIAKTITSTISPVATTAIKKLSSIAQWCNPETNVVKNEVLNCCTKADWPRVLKSMSKNVLTHEVYLLSAILSAEIKGQLEMWSIMDATMLQVANLEDATEEHYTFIEQAGEIINGIEDTSASLGNPAILGIIHGYCKDMPKTRMQQFAVALEKAFLTNQKLLGK